MGFVQMLFTNDLGANIIYYFRTIHKFVRVLHIEKSRPTTMKNDRRTKTKQMNMDVKWREGKKNNVAAATNLRQKTNGKTCNVINLNHFLFLCTLRTFHKFYICHTDQHTKKNELRPEGSRRRRTSESDSQHVCDVYLV